MTAHSDRMPAANQNGHEISWDTEEPYQLKQIGQHVENIRYISTFKLQGDADESFPVAKLSNREDVIEYPTLFLCASASTSEKKAKFLQELSVMNRPVREFLNIFLY
ncbi:hypothetical protein K435DRAFT_869608 [Dendrothele bispora CBS 962.96]|uniref:Uncharacterized protein n=1 Tax=Dendrothele bispora (strain CBS 962.96) TaxID=1314807 RepID=A0A4S8L982_DENBC|nr:hypothetical protein K435DRAFT_869608 [Dendrothele bispora CBS 962.96]